MDILNGSVGLEVNRMQNRYGRKENITEEITRKGKVGGADWVMSEILKFKWRYCWMDLERCMAAWKSGCVPDD